MPRRILTIVGLVLSIAVVSSLVALVPAVTAQQAEGDTSPSDILDSPDDYFDQDVTLQNATVADSVSSQAFTLIGDGDELLVVGSRDVIPDDISTDSTVTIEGTVREFTDDADFVDDLGITVDQRAYRDFEGGPVVYASSVNITGDSGEESSQNGMQVPEATPLSTVMEDPSSFYGDQVTILAEIDEHISDDAELWTVSTKDVDDELLVVAQIVDVPGGVTEGAIVRVTGTLGELAPDEPFQVIDTEGNSVVIDTDDPAFDDYDEQPMLGASSIEVVAPALDQMIDNILDDPVAYYGEKVTLFGTVDNVGGNRAFSYDGPEGFLGLTEETLLVVGSPDVMTQRIEEDDVVQVTGTVRPFNSADVEGWDEGVFDSEDDSDSFYENTDDEFIAGFDDRPVVVADSVDVLATDRGETIEDILDNSDDYLGTEVRVAGMVNDNVTSQAFTLEGTDGFFGISEDNLLVIGQEQMLQNAGITEDAIVIVSGTVREYDPDDQFEFGGQSFEIEDVDALSDWEDDEVLVADSVNVIVID
ncbi:MAG: hypothetical protein R2849_22830 [Thermomicrobiales bacterium]